MNARFNGMSGPTRVSSLPTSYKGRQSRRGHTSSLNLRPTCGDGIILEVPNGGTATEIAALRGPHGAHRDGDAQHTDGGQGELTLSRSAVLFRGLRAFAKPAMPID